MKEPFGGFKSAKWDFTRVPLERHAESRQASDGLGGSAQVGYHRGIALDRLGFYVDVGAATMRPRQASRLLGRRAMNRDSGLRNFPIWLIGDSSPAKWEAHLVYPLDSKHPARHNIWTPILEGIQSHLYASTRKRLHTDDLYIRNAVHHPSDKPHGNAVTWSSDLEEETREMARLFDSHAPKLVFSFGAFAFEFARRGHNESPHHAFRDWSTERLGQEFRQRIQVFTPRDINLIPLLHVSIARGHFLSGHKNFTQMEDGNYFDYVGQQIADCLSRNQTGFPIY